MGYIFALNSLHLPSGRVGNRNLADEKGLASILEVEQNAFDVIRIEWVGRHN